MIKKLFILAAVLASSLAAQSFQINNLFSSDMVLQRNEQIVFSGNCSPNQVVQLKFNEKNFQSISGESGKWTLILPPHRAGGPFDLIFSSGGEKIELTNVLFGDVWIASGQSNMNMPMAGWGRVKNYKHEISAANYQKIRLLTIPLTLAEEPKNFVKTDGWKVCSPENIENFSALAYFFGREIFTETGVPIGLIHVSKGGTPIEAWMCRDMLSDRVDLKEKIEFVANGSAETFKDIEDEYKNRMRDWYLHTFDIDPGFISEPEWYSNKYDYSDWRKAYCPQVWENFLGDYDGIVWFKKEIDIPESWTDSDLRLELGPVQDYDVTYFNGVKIGEQRKRDNLSIYAVPSKLVKPGKNVITVRVLDVYGNGGLWGRFDIFEIGKDAENKISLKGEWLYKTAIELKNFDQPRPKRPLLDRYPTILFNGMISPLTEQKIKGAIWYQGESNGKNAFQYRDMFKRMINHWRAHFKTPQMPFYFVQLANYKKHKTEPDPDDTWAILRESQAEALSLPNTGMATAIDIGDRFDVHPKNKQELGRRLALWALRDIYGKQIVVSGPSQKSIEIQGNKIVISFENAAGGLKTTDGKPPREFIIAGPDGKFFNASAKIDGSRVIVWNDDVPNPVEVRYAWQFNPNVNLVNMEMLPALPFRNKAE